MHLWLNPPTTTPSSKSTLSDLMSISGTEYDRNVGGFNLISLTPTCITFAACSSQLNQHFRNLDDIDLNFWWVELAGRAIVKALNTIKLSRLSPELSRGDDHEDHPS
jgi:hypothetical protein